MPGLNRRMGRKGRMRDGIVQTVLEFFAHRDLFADQLQDQESRVPFVHVENRGLDTQHPQEPHAADTQHHFLHDPGGRIASVNACRHLAQVARVLLHVAIQKIERTASHTRHPYTEEDGGAHDVDLPHERVAIGFQNRLHRQVARIEHRIGFDLPVIPVNGLLEISVPIEKGDSDKAQSQIAGRFGMVARKHTETSGGYRQRLMKTELG